MIKKHVLQYVLRNSSWTYFGGVITTFFALASGVVFANYLTQVQYGQYKFFITILEIVTLTSLYGVSVSLTRAISLKKHGSYIKAFILKLKWSLLGSLGCLLASGYYFYTNATELAIGFLLIGLLQPLYENFKVFQNFLTGQKRFKQLAFYQTLNSCLVITLVALATIIFQNPLVSIATYLASYTLLRGIQFFNIKKKLTNNDIDENLVPFGSHITIQQIINVLASHLDKILVWQFLGASQLAIMAFAFLPVNHLKGLFKSLRSVVFTKFTTIEYGNLQKLLPVYIALYGLILIIVTLIYMVTAPYIFKIAFPQYIEATAYSQFFAITLILLFASPIAQAFNAHMKTKELYFITLIQPAIRIILLFSLIPTYGIWGVIIAHLAAESFSAFSALIQFLRNRKA